MNRIAGLLAGTLPETERQPLLAEVIYNEEAKQLLLLANTYGIEEIIRYDHPFSIQGGALIGVSKEFLQAFSLNDAKLDGKSSNLCTLVERLSRGKWCTWLKGQVELVVNSGRLDEVLPLTIEVQGDEILVRTATRTFCDDTMEVWKDGKLFRTAPIEMCARHPIPEVRAGTFLAFRFLDEEQGFYLNFVESEFGLSDCWSACLSCALSGDYHGALKILTTLIPSFYLNQTDIRKVIHRLRLVGAFCRVEQMYLKPMPIFRSSFRDLIQEASIEDLLLESSRHVFPVDFLDESRELESRGGGRHIIRNLEMQCFHGHDKGKKDVEPYSSLIGWKYLLEKEYEKAQLSFLSANPNSSDLYCIHEGLALAQHLNQCHRGDNQASIQESGLKVWEMVFHSVLPPI